MQRAGIGFPIEFRGDALKLDIDIVRLNSQRPIQSRFLVGETASVTISEGNLLERKAVPRIQINRALQATDRLFLFALATLNVTLQLENTGIIGQRFGSDLQFGESGIVVEVTPIKVLRACQVRFPCIRM